jgi:hypothetical protein
MIEGLQKPQNATECNMNQENRTPVAAAATTPRVFAKGTQFLPWSMMLK